MSAVVARRNPFARANRAEKSLARVEHALSLVAQIAVLMPRDATASSLAEQLEAWGSEERACAARTAHVDVPDDDTWAIVVSAFRGVRRSARAA